MVAPRPDHRRIETLSGLLDEIAEAHKDLLDAVEEKIAAMRTADTERIKQAMEREQALVERIDEREGVRRQLTENIARGYGIGGAAARRLSVRKLADRVGGAQAEAIVAAGQRLQKLTAQIAQRNHVAQLISQNILRHMTQVFAAMTVSRDGAVGYSPAGDVFAGGGERIFDAVG